MRRSNSSPHCVCSSQTCTSDSISAACRSRVGTPRRRSSESTAATSFPPRCSLVFAREIRFFFSATSHRGSRRPYITPRRQRSPSLCELECAEASSRRRAARALSHFFASAIAAFTSAAYACQPSAGGGVTSSCAGPSGVGSGGVEGDWEEAAAEVASETIVASSPSSSCTPLCPVPLTTSTPTSPAPPSACLPGSSKCVASSS
mmetsp:Transcript_9059/g.22492  ORF Transcript_9059/g.22492 Transcript_9059/m.22492 type:complete len:204 (-) Transcript_9059:826-1437(-)